MEKASARRDAALGFELLLALPMPTQCPVAVSQAMVELFIRTVIVDKHGLAATVAVHAPHDTRAEGDEDTTELDDDAFAQVMSGGLGKPARSRSRQPSTDHPAGPEPPGVHGA